MPELLIRGGTVVDALGERRADVLVEDARVVAVDERLEAGRAALVLDAGGAYVLPGLVDLHAHLREPGGEDAETVESGSRAAALGGYTAVVAMPNTEPPVDSAAVARDVLALGRDALVEVAVAGAITRGRLGETLAPMAELAAVGVRLFTDDGRGVADAGLLRRALEYARDLGVVVAEHCEDPSLAAGGVVHEGEWSSRLGLPGQPSLAEEAMLARDLALVRLVGTRFHALHLSTAGSVALVAAAKADGLPVTAEVTPHHLVFCDEAVAGFDPVFRVSPPLRPRADVAALRRALSVGVVDAVATDHAPHPPERKDLAFDEAAPGMLGLETALAVAFTFCAADGDHPARRSPRADAVRAGTSSGRSEPPGVVTPGGAEERLRPAELFARLSWLPARVAGLDRAAGGEQGGPLEPGAPANLCVFDPSASIVVDPSRLASRSRNTPFAGLRLRGRVRHTVFRGDPVVLDGEAQR
jgi:dihydroorotase